MPKPKPLAAIAFAIITTAACGHADVPRSSSTTTTTTNGPIAAAAVAVSSTPPPPPVEELPPLEGQWIEKLDVVVGHKEEVAYAAIPIGARDKRAIIVGVHGAGDHADWSCSEWKAVAADWAFVVCPQGVTHPTDKSAFVWGSAAAIAAQADRAVAALRAKYSQWIADGPLIYAGWSQGASLASQVIASRPGVYDRVALVEVGHTPLDVNAVAKGFATGGIRRAVVSCSSTKCRSFAQTFEPAARHLGIPSQTNDVGLRGHWFDGPVFRTLAPKVVWMVSDESRFAGLSAAVDARYMTD